MIASLKDDARLSGAYPVNTMNGLPDSRSFRATGSHVSRPTLTSRTATSHGSSLSAWFVAMAGSNLSALVQIFCIVRPPRRAVGTRAPYVSI
jgi:hypothetical protein